MIQILSKYGQMLLFAMGQTLLLALWGLFFACILGMIFGLLSVVRNKVCNVIASIFVDILFSLVCLTHSKIFSAVK